MVVEDEADTATRVFETSHHQRVDVCGGELTVLQGSDVGRRIGLGPTTLTVGTARSSHLRLTDPTVSRLHCQFSPRRDGVRLRDAGSTNGTFVDGVRVRDVDLLGGATVQVGATVLRLELGNEPLAVPLSDKQRFGSLIGGSVEMRRLYALLERVAKTDATVLIQGETGTGKELVARELHQHSARANGPFVAVDCGAIAPTVIESELFGHVRGAFSGAVADRRGLFEEAHGGTLYLDEIGELPLASQAKLLRALELHEVRRVGANTTRQIDVRVLTATNRSLAESVNDGSFREDLYYRIAVIEIGLVPLRQRREDIPALATDFYQRFTDGTQPVPQELLASLMTKSWPGNVRELRNYVERSVTLGIASRSERQPSAGSSFGATPTALAIDLGAPLKEARHSSLDRYEEIYVTAALHQANGNVTRAAERAGVSRRFLQRLIARLGIRNADSDPFTDADSESEIDSAPDHCQCT